MKVVRNWILLVVTVCAGCTPVVKQQGINGISALRVQDARTVYLKTSTNTFGWTRYSNESMFSAGTLSVGETIYRHGGVNCRTYLRLHSISPNHIAFIEKTTCYSCILPFFHSSETKEILTPRNVIAGEAQVGSASPVQ